MLQPLQDITLKAALPDAAPRPLNTFPPLPDPWDAAHQDREKQGELRGNPPKEVHDLIRRYDDEHAGGQHHARSDPHPDDTSVYDSENDDDDSEAVFILKDTSAPESDEALYEFVDDEEELDAVFKIFEQLLDDEE